MGFTRLILLFILASFAYSWLRTRWRRFFNPPKPQVPPLFTPQPLVPCDHCGTRIPLNTVVLDHDRMYCNAQCHQAAVGHK
ncbi:MAG: hypothetical protein H7833_03935 [Magnetococcus sp. DMHC-1]|nr:hypothetical protein [Magnetococcales bacterium]